MALSFYYRPTKFPRNWKISMRWEKAMSMLINSVGQIKDLRKCIARKRKELINLGSNYGLLDKKTIKCS